MLKYILLGFLQYNPMTGYDLKAQLATSTMHFWHAYHSQIYTTLRTLEEDGLLESVMTDETPLGKRIYSITASGRAALDEWLAQPQTRVSPSKHELLVRLFFSGRRDKAAILDELRIQRRLHQDVLATYQQFPTQGWDNPPGSETRTASEPFFWLATLDYGQRYEEMYIAWLDDLIAQLEAL